MTSRQQQPESVHNEPQISSQNSNQFEEAKREAQPRRNPREQDRFNFYQDQEDSYHLRSLHPNDM